MSSRIFSIMPATYGLVIAHLDQRLSPHLKSVWASSDLEFILDRCLKVKNACQILSFIDWCWQKRVEPVSCQTEHLGAVSPTWDLFRTWGFAMPSMANPQVGNKPQGWWNAGWMQLGAGNRMLVRRVLGAHSSPAWRVQSENNKGCCWTSNNIVVPPSCFVMSDTRYFAITQVYTINWVCFDVFVLIRFREVSKWPHSVGKYYWSMYNGFQSFSLYSRQKVW